MPIGINNFDPDNKEGSKTKTHFTHNFYFSSFRSAQTPDYSPEFLDVELVFIKLPMSKSLATSG